MSSLLHSVMFPPPTSLLANAMSAVSVASLAYTGASEAVGSHLQYSKFWDAAASTTKRLALGGGVRVPSRAGMVALYAPALAAALAAFAFPAVVGAPRGVLVASALAIHFFKRVLEVLFVHQYSGNMILDSVIPISISYFINTVFTIYGQYLTQGMSEPPIDLKYPGIILFLVGISGNFYHHVLLSKLRKKGEKGYKIPKGGLFETVICPHYLFEIIGFIGISFISQTLHSFAFLLGTTFYLLGRSYATRKWYLSKFENFPREIKVLIPYVF
uniref:3-oxo-5-alpha-steroid 4-dehydrogenase 1 n=1 Tax=Anthurium amnicola TaxID=1678845 RepID=A0A1D1ZBP2_9ARAE